MSRSMLLVLGIVLFAGNAPTRGQGLLDAFVEGFVEGMNDADHDHDHGHWNNNGNWNNGQKYYHPVHPKPQHQKIWNGSYWEYVPISPSVVYPSTTIVTPATTNVVANALPYKGPGVTIALEEEVGGQVAYVIDGRESATIQAGQQQTLTNKGKYEIRFSRGRSADGRDFGQARYTVTEGNYHFEVTDKGWELLRDKEQPNIVTTQIQSASPAGIKTNALPPKAAPAAAQTPAAAAPATAAAAPAATAPATAAAPAAAATAQPSKPAVAPAAGSVPTNTIPPKPAAGG